MRPILFCLTLAVGLVSCVKPISTHKKQPTQVESTTVAVEPPPRPVPDPVEVVVVDEKPHVVVPPPVFELPLAERNVRSGANQKVAWDDPRLLTWVDSVYASMSDERRIGQLLMLRAHSDRDALYEQQVEDQIRVTHAGGLCFFQGTLERQAILTNRYQAISTFPLMISMDAEYGLGMRLKDGITYPRQMTLGAIQDDILIYAFGLEMARQCRRLGVHVSFSPSADVNNNPGNPVINDRSFGENVRNVSRKALFYQNGLEDGGVICSVKHFPGHGDTDVDSHYGLPVIHKTKEDLDAVELAPFKTLITAGAASVMVGHLNVPAWESDSKRPSSLSKSIVTDLLRNQLNFNRLVFTDGMEMDAVSNNYPSGQAALQALQAGCDIVLLPGDPIMAHATIKMALDSGMYDRKQMEASVKRVLTAKYRYGISKPQRVQVENVAREINTPEAYLLKRQLFESAMTIVTSQDFQQRACLAPVQAGGASCIATLSLGDPTANTVFQRTCRLFGAVDHFGTGRDIDPVTAAKLLDSLSRYDEVLISHHKTRSRLKDNYGLTESQIQLVHQLSRATSVRFTVFGNPYCLRYFEQIPAVMVAFTEDSLAQESAAQAWFGANPVRGKLPVTANQTHQFGAGYESPKVDRSLFRYSSPESVGLNSDTLALMDELVRDLIGTGAAPGCQILVARHGTVVWHKAYGHYTYDQTQKVTTETLYDLASVTKVAATTLSGMKLYDMGQFDPAQYMSNYVPGLRNTNKNELIGGDILAHQAGLQAWIPFYEKTLDANKLPHTRIYRMTMDSQFNVPVAPNLWMRRDYLDTLWQNIYRSDLRATRDYKYSDLTMYLMAQAIQHQSNMLLDKFVQTHFYQPMGLKNVLYNPWAAGRTDDCAPTEIDNYFRQQRIQGYVHDMGAAMLGGVSGHAGLFGNANDVAKLFQLLLNGGRYNNIQYLRPETVRYWTTRYNGSTRRGLGFDMKELNPSASMNMSPLAGPNTFGHAGFTGNVVWADPDSGILFVFLSNRTYPSMNNNKLINGDYRPRLHSIVYRSIIN
jgi:beta-N-acetylhexosaminidase